jgi:hypothetical protein
MPRIFVVLCMLALAGCGRTTTAGAPNVGASNSGAPNVGAQNASTPNASTPVASTPNASARNATAPKADPRAEYQNAIDAYQACVNSNLKNVDACEDKRVQMETSQRAYQGR